MGIVNQGNTWQFAGSSPRTPTLPFTPTAGNALVVFFHPTILGTATFTVNGISATNPLSNAIQVFLIPAAAVTGTTLTLAWTGGGAQSADIVHVWEIDGDIPAHVYVSGNIVGNSVTTPADTPENSMLFWARSDTSTPSTVTGVTGTGMIGYPTSTPDVWFGAYSADLGSSAASQAASMTVSGTTAPVQGPYLILGSPPPPPPDLTSVNGGTSFASNATGITFTGTNLGATTGDRTVSLVQGATVVTQTQTAGDATSGAFDVVGFGLGGLLRYGVATVLRVDDGAQTDEIAVTINPPAGYAYVDIGSINPEGIETSPPLEVGWQLRYNNQGGLLTILPDSTPSVLDESVVSTGVSVQDGSGWSPEVTVNFSPEDNTWVPGSSSNAYLRMRARGGMRIH